MRPIGRQNTEQVLYGQIEGMVGRGGLEPPTSRLSGVRSNHLSYRPVVCSASSAGVDIRRLGFRRISGGGRSALRALKGSLAPNTQAGLPVSTTLPLR